jgi:hypothetical protein
MTNDSSIVSKISTTSKKDSSCVNKISLPNILKVHKSLYEINKSNVHDFYPKNFNHALLPKPEFESYRNEVKKRYEYDKISLM